MQLLFREPLLNTTSAHLISLGLGTVYVGSIYLARNARLRFGQPGGKGSRDDPEIIRARLVAVSAATLGCCAGVFGVLWGHVGGTFRNLDISFDAALLRLGFVWPGRTVSSVLPHLVTPVLFLGPLFASGYLTRELPGMKNWSWRSYVRDRFFTLQGVRNYCIAPITEEIVFRACILSIYHLSGASRTRMIFLAPLTFGLAHVHHAWETFNRYGRNAAAAQRAALSSVFQLAYTTLFGFHVSYLFLRTGSILPPITAHIFCNIMGVPNIGWELKHFPRYKRVIIGVYLLGIAGFVYTLGRWTHTPDNFYWPAEEDMRFRYARY